MTAWLSPQSSSMSNSPLGRVSAASLSQRSADVTGRGTGSVAPGWPTSPTSPAIRGANGGPRSATRWFSTQRCSYLPRTDRRSSSSPGDLLAPADEVRGRPGRSSAFRSSRLRAPGALHLALGSSRSSSSSGRGPRARPVLLLRGDRAAADRHRALIVNYLAPVFALWAWAVFKEPVAGESGPHSYSPSPDSRSSSTSGRGHARRRRRRGGPRRSRRVRRIRPHGGARREVPRPGVARLLRLPLRGALLGGAQPLWRFPADAARRQRLAARADLERVRSRLVLLGLHRPPGTWSRSCSSRRAPPSLPRG